MLRRFGGLIVLVVLVGGIGLVGWMFRDRLSGAAGDLAVGDCFEVPTADQVENVQHRPCTDPHDGEVFYVADYPNADAYPPKADFESWVSSNCLGTVFESYVGAKYEDRTDVDVVWFSPTDEGWKNGDHEVSCVLSPADGSKVSTSYRAASSGG